MARLMPLIDVAVLILILYIGWQVVKYIKSEMKKKERK